MKINFSRQITLMELVVAIIMLVPASAATNIIDFEDLSDEQQILTHYPGLTFDPDAQNCDPACLSATISHSGVNVIGDFADNRIRIDFDSAVSRVGIWYIAFGFFQEGNIEAYDKDNNMIDRDHSGSTGIWDYLEVSSTKIKYIVVHGAYVFDDLEYDKNEPELGAKEYRLSEYHYPGYEWDPYPLLFRSWNDVLFTNSGQGGANNVVATITCKPDNVNVIDGVVDLGNIPAGSSSWSKDFFKLEIDMTNPQVEKKGILWKVEFDDSAGNHHVIENLPEFHGDPINCP